MPRRRTGKYLRPVNQVALALGDLRFQKSPGHATVTNYTVKLYAKGTVSPTIDTLALGVPFPDGNGFITRNIRKWLDSHPGGDYDVHVSATNAGGTDESVSSNSFTVPVS